MASARQTRIKQRRKTQRKRAAERTARRAARQEARTRRAEGRQAVRRARIGEKGKSGFWSPEGITARGDVGLKLVDKGLEVATKIPSKGGGLLGGLLGGDTSPESEMDFFADEQGRRSPQFGGGGGGSSTDIEVIEEKAPFYTNPLFIAAAVGGVLFLTMGRGRGKKNGNGS